MPAVLTLQRISMSLVQVDQRAGLLYTLVVSRGVWTTHRTTWRKPKKKISYQLNLETDDAVNRPTTAPRQESKACAEVSTNRKRAYQQPGTLCKLFISEKNNGTSINCRSLSIVLQYFGTNLGRNKSLTVVH